MVVPLSLGVLHYPPRFLLVLRHNCFYSLLRRGIRARHKYQSIVTLLTDESQKAGAPDYRKVKNKKAQQDENNMKKLMNTKRTTMLTMPLGMLACLLMSVSFNALAHDPSLHKEAAEAPECSALNDLDESKKNPDDVVYQAMKKKCMDALDHDEDAHEHEHSEKHEQESDSDQPHTH